MNWHKVWVVGRHEYVINVKKAGFIIMTAAIPALGIIALLLATVFSGASENLLSNIARQFEIGDRPIGVVDRTGDFSPIDQPYQEDLVLFANEEQAEAALRDEEISKVMVITEDYLETGEIIAISDGDNLDAASISDSDTVRAFLLDHLLEGRGDPAVQERVTDPINVSLRSLDGDEDEAESNPLSMVLNMIVPYILSVFLMMTIFTSSGYLLRSVSEEKESRVIEVVVSSVRPIELMAGKVLGLGALGLTQVLVWLISTSLLSGGATALLAAAGAIALPSHFLILGILYYLLGFTLYAILMAGFGSLGTTMQESQKLAGIFSFGAAIPYMLSGLLFANPNSVVARILSYFPLTSPTMMMMRMALTTPPWTEITLSLGLLALSLPAALWVGAKLFQVGLLIYGKRPTLKEIWLILRGRS